MREDKPKLSATDLKQILATASAMFAPDGSAAAQGGRVWDAASVDALIDKSVAEAHAETARKFAAAAAGKDYGGGVDGIFAGLKRWTLDMTDSAVAAAEAEWSARYEMWRQESIAKAQAVPLGRGARIRQSAHPPVAARAESPVTPVAGGHSETGGGGDAASPKSGRSDEDEEFVGAADGEDSLEEDEEYVVSRSAVPPPPSRVPFAPAAAHVVDPNSVLRRAFESARLEVGIDFPAAAAACGVKFVQIAAWLSPESPAQLDREALGAVFKWVVAHAPGDVAKHVRDVCGASITK